jgi:hypothetical protein
MLSLLDNILRPMGPSIWEKAGQEADTFIVSQGGLTGRTSTLFCFSPKYRFRLSAKLLSTNLRRCAYAEATAAKQKSVEHLIGMPRACSSSSAEHLLSAAIAARNQREADLLVLEA